MSDDSKSIPPYVSYVTFQGFIEELANTTVPAHIDRSMLPKLSGANQTALLSALRFLGMTAGDDDETTSALRELVEARRAGEDAWKQALTQLLDEKYSSILGEVKITNTTRARLTSCFTSAGVKAGQMTEKSMRFYIHALKDAGVKVSEHVTKASRKAAKRKAAPKKPAKRDQGDGTPPPPPSSTTPAEGFARLPIPGVDGGYIEYPKNLSEADCVMYETMVGALRKYVEVQTGEEETS